jgi:subtilase family serine protease
MRIAFRVFFAVAAILLASCAGGGMSPPQTGERVPQAGSANVNAPFSYGVHPVLRRTTDLLAHNCPGGTAGCALAPTTVRTAYNFTYLKGAQDGSGQQIVIVVAYGSPTIQNDLKTFDAAFGLPDPTLTIVYPGGNSTVNLSNAVQLGWAEETNLDVEWAHAAAPGASIVLVVGNNDQGQTIQSTLQYAASHYPGAVMSLSFGTPESSINGGANNTQLKASQAVYATARSNNMTVIASAGDLGATNGFAAPNPQYPASDPNVLSVGGTSLSLFNNGKYRSESAWNDGASCAMPCGATGGAPSALFGPFSANETLLTGDSLHRDVADVAFDAGDQAVDVYIGFSAPGPPAVTPGWYAMGGTSVGPPVVGGMIAVANQMRAAQTPAKGPLGWINDALYGAYTGAQATKTPPFHDVVGGSNVFLPSGSTGFNAVAGYDNPTGLGTPNVNNLLSLLTSL